jgi:glutathione S-transferase
MILIGQYDSPFVRRVAIALRHYELPFEHRSWSVWADAAKIAVHNPLRRVPTLLLEDGTALVETFAILDALDEFVGPERALLPASGAGRQDGMRICALAGGVAARPSLCSTRRSTWCNQGRRGPSVAERRSWKP